MDSKNATTSAQFTGVSAKPDGAETYDFTKVVGSYNAYRPDWSAQQALHTLETAGITFKDGKWHGIQGADKPTIISIGSGTGADAMEFLKLGCRVFYTDTGYFPTPQEMQGAKSSAMAETVRQNIIKLQRHMVDNPGPMGMGEAIVIPNNATQIDIYGVKADVVVMAQALHTFKTQHAKSLLNAKQLAAGLPAEELSREEFARILPDDGAARLSVWYYNPDPHDPKVWELQDILNKASQDYAKSTSPLLNADYFRQPNMLPYINKDEMKLSGLQDVDVVELKESDLEGWLLSYSFGKSMIKGEDRSMFEASVAALKEWHAKHADPDGVLRLKYVGQITQGPVRAQPYTLEPAALANIHRDPWDGPDNLYVSNDPRPEGHNFNL